MQDILHSVEGDSAEPIPEGKEPTPIIVPAEPAKKFKLRPFPIVAIISTFISVVFAGFVNVAMKACSFAAIDAVAGKPTPQRQVLPPIVLPPEVPKIEELQETIFKEKEFVVTTRVKRHVLAMKVPPQWKIEKNKTLPSMLGQFYREERGHGFAMIVVTAMDTISHFDLWTTLTKEEMVAKAKKSQPASNPTILSYEKAMLCGVQAMEGLSEFTEEGERVRFRSVMLYADTLMLVIGIHTMGEGREADSKFYEKEFRAFVNSFIIDGDSGDLLSVSDAPPSVTSIPPSK